MTFPLNLRGKARRAGTDADAALWAAAVTANGGTYSAATLAAVSTFAKAAKASGYWTKLNRINLFCGNQLAAALVPLKVGGGSATETNVNFVGGDYTEATGITGNGTTKYLNTGLNPSVSLTVNDTHVALYTRGTTAQLCSIGANDATNYIQALMPFDVSHVYSYHNSAAPLDIANPGAPFGLMVSTRTASNLQTVYKAGASIGSSASANALALPNLSMYALGSNNNAAPAYQSASPCGGYSIGSGLTAGDVTAYNTHMQAFQTALSRNV